MNRSKIEKMSYPEFVAFIGQDNSPPGGKESVQVCADDSNITPDSYVLDLACNNGFTSRLLAREIKCKCVGVDISAPAIEMAKTLSKEEGVEDLLEFHEGNAESMDMFESATFTHIMSGCNFGFIQDRNKALEESVRVLKPGGQLCTANFFYHTPPSDDILNQVNDAIGFRPNAEWNFDWWNSFFSQRLELKKERSKELRVWPEQELKNAIYNYIFNNCEKLKDQPEDIREASFQRLFEIRRILNEHRKYQSYSISTWVRPTK